MKETFWCKLLRLEVDSKQIYYKQEQTCKLKAKYSRNPEKEAKTGC